MRIPNRSGGTRNKLAGPASAMRFLTRTRPGLKAGLILLGLAAAAATVAVPTSASASTVTSPVVGYTYVDGNTAPANTIDGYARHADGSLTPLAGSPFSAGGSGLGSGLASQGAIQVTADGRYLLAVDAGSNQISVLRLTANGVPVLVGQPVSSAGITPVSVAVSPFGLVYVANQGNGGSGYSGFRLNRDGSLTPIAGSTVTVPDGSGLGDVFFNASGNHLIGTRTGTSLIDSFVVLPGGRLLAAHGSPFTGPGPRPARRRVLAQPTPRSCSSATRTTAPASGRSRPIISRPWPWPGRRPAHPDRKQSSILGQGPATLWRNAARGGG